MLRIPQIHFFFLTVLTAQTAQTEEFMFQNVAYWPTVYRTGFTSTCCCRTVWCFDFSTKIPTHLFSNSCWYHQEFCFDKAFGNLYLNFISISLHKLKFYIPIPSIKFKFQKAWWNGIFIWCIFIVISPFKNKIVVFYGQVFLLFIRKSA